MSKLKLHKVENVLNVCVNTYDFDGLSQDKTINQTQTYTCGGVDFIYTVTKKMGDNHITSCYY